MAPPIITQTWTHLVNQVVLPEATIQGTNRANWWAWKQGLDALGWTVSRSSNSVTSANADLLTSRSSIVYGFYTDGSAKSWGVFNRPNGLPGQLLWSPMGASLTAETTCLFGWSPSGSFTGGNHTTLPQAPDTLWVNGSSQTVTNYINQYAVFFPYTTNVRRVWHFLQSEDGKLFWAIQCANTQVQSLLMIHTPANARSQFANQAMLLAPIEASPLTYAKVVRASTIRMRAKDVSGNFLDNLSFTCEMGAGVALGQLWYARDVDGELIMSPVSVWSNGPISPGILGDIPDLWMGSSLYNPTGSTYADHLGNRRAFVTFNDVILPWNGSTPLTA